MRTVKGRNRNMALSPEGKPYWPVLGLSRFRTIIPSLRQYQLVQTGLDAITLKLVCEPPPTAKQLQALQTVMTEALGYSYRLDCQIYTAELPLTASGKFEEFISLMPALGTTEDER